MSGTVTVTRTHDWLTPFEVTVKPDVGRGASAKFMAAAKAQTYALNKADETGFTLVYVDDSRVPTNKGNPETQSAVQAFQERYQRICSKCRQAKPLTNYGGIYHRNRTTGREVFHGYNLRCDSCIEDAT